MTKPSSSVPPSEPTDSAGASTTTASSPSAEGKRKGKVGRMVKWIRWALKRGIWGPENEDSDKIWEKRAYPIIRVFGIFGTVVLLWLGLPPLLQDISENGSISGNETVRNASYFLIFVGGALATSIATWRGRQSEKQILLFEQQIQDSRLERQNARFERALDMATDQKSRARRAVGFRILGQMLFDWLGNFDSTTIRKIYILDYLAFNSFKRTRKQEKAFGKLYEDSKMSYGMDEIKRSGILFDKTEKPDIKPMALNLWQAIVDWNMRGWGNPTVAGIYATETTPNGSHFFIFSGGSLENLKFFVTRDREKIISSTQSMRAGFKRSCFLIVDMHGATVDHVDFSESHFDKINLEVKSLENCKMSCVGTIFNFANLIDCNFRGADFEDASFIGANITGSDFRLAKNLTQKQFLQGAYWILHAKPRFPNSFPYNFADELPNEPPTEEMIRKWEMEAGLSP